MRGGADTSKWKMAGVLALLLGVALMTACEREPLCTCDQLFSSDTEESESVCGRCICPEGTILQGLGPKAVQNEVDCADTADCEAGYECREGKCANIEENNPDRFHACTKADGSIHGRYMRWDKDQNLLVECHYRDGKRHEYCDVYDSNGTRLHHCIYQDGAVDPGFSVGVCVASCQDMAEDAIVTVQSGTINDTFPTNGCDADGNPLESDAGTEGDATDGDASTDADGDAVSTDADGDAVSTDADGDAVSTDADGDAITDASTDATTDAADDAATADDVATDTAATDAADDAATDAAATDAADQ